MTETAPGRPPALGALRLIGDSFRLLFANCGVFFPLALAPALIVEAVNIALVPAGPPEAVTLTLGALVASLVGALIGYLVVGLLCLATVDAVSGARRGLEAYVRAVLPHIVPLFVLGVVLSVATAIAMLFFVLPGLYVLAQFLVWVQVVVLERGGMGALGRAQALSKGYRWPLVGALILLALLFAAGMLVAVQVIAVGDAGPGQLFAALASAVVVAFLNAVIAIFSTLVYLRLRAIREGAAPEEIAAAV